MDGQSFPLSLSFKYIKETLKIAGRKQSSKEGPGLFRKGTEPSGRRHGLH